jgi:hypothetical protein
MSTDNNINMKKKNEHENENSKEIATKSSPQEDHVVAQPQPQQLNLPAPPSDPGDDAGDTNNLVEEEEEKKESFMQAAGSKALRPFVIISSSYLLFTITDGAIRMIVLLHAYNKSFSALEVAIMFTLYELAGVFTNLVCTLYLFHKHVERTSKPFFFKYSILQAAGAMGARWGIKFTLITGLTLQLFSYGLLFAWDDSWTKKQAILYVTFAQMFAGTYIAHSYIMLIA